ncbi:probable inactive receptor kinase At5g16590 [Cynara cardunculus var. scolymus]|uniref:probable inactive receptor kinase At5g16590 n=1 Tax=Cynara cardunculus var. scolymus TaxID=59895 RepID=UPI000D6236F9|nr:probable inactive receptor kinase At5g16590 [Cynara cardunculus var. scolymus]
MNKLHHSWQFFFILIMFILCGLYRAITFISTKVAKSTNTKVTNPTPISLEVKVRLPTRVIFGDDQTLRRFDPSELVQLPKNRLGEGSLGTLYKVVLDCGLTITIRRIRKEITSVGDFEYWVRFFGGVCDDHWLLPMWFGFWYGREAFVIHEYLCLGSLEELLHGSEGVQFTPLSWKIRQQITLGAAKAVASIHSRFTETGEPLVCGVIKSSNFLLQADFSPRLSSYETPYFISPSTIIRRNCGRMAPELTRTRRISKSFTQASDVYSFGILMLELISGKKPSVTNLGQYVAEKRKREGPKGVPDKRMSDVTENVSLMIIIAGHCLSSDPKQRPSMGRIVEMIQAALE